MKVIGIVGSPRKNGNTDILVQQVLKGASAAGAETKIFYLNELNFQGCQGCGTCKVNGRCRLQDDMTPMYNEMYVADAVVLGSPVYSWYVTGQTKLILDRCSAFLNPDFSSRLGKGKKAALVFSQGDPDRERFRRCFDDLVKMLVLVGLEIQDTLIASGVNEAGVVVNDEALMQKAQIIGEQLCEV